MWTNQMLKQNAWNSLKPYYWTAFGVTFVTSLLGGNSNFSGSFGGSGASNSYSESGGGSDLSSGEAIGILIAMLIVFVIAMAIALAVYSFLGGVVKCGECKFFCKARTGDVNFGYVFDNFQGGRYMPTVKVMFQMQLEITLWSLLFIIPGVIKSYEYALVPYLMAENPYLTKERALQISKQTMDGEKMKFFSLGLSFIGWLFLGAMACGFGIMFVTPYMEATYAEFYTCMRAKMIATGITSEEELTGYNNYNNFGGGYPQQDNYNSYVNQNPYQNQNYYQNPADPYQNQNPYQNPADPYQNQSPYQNSYPQDNHTPHVNLDKNPYDNNNNNNPY
ncbi:MAG: DUF975 family protein [Oscillospiraceae bacterium]|nr:DUF975 family protein [Oscillospiraceae bacterium]